MSSNGFTPIPQPPTIPLLGNITNIDADLPYGSFLLLRQQYGPIFQLDMLGRKVVVVSSQNFAHQIADETKFRKAVAGALREVRALVHDGLFTAYHDEPNWGVAHRILMPAFGPASVRGMYADMMDICSQLVLKWARIGSNQPINPPDDFTRLAFDTIALCAMSYRLNSYYQEDTPEFIKAMGSFLTESMHRARRPHLLQAVMMQTNAQYQADIKLMNGIADQIVAERRANPNDKKDLLNLMMYGKDPKTGATLSDETIRNEFVTFLIAGHETTSGMLSFTVYHLLKNPRTYAKLQAEVDSVLGDRIVQLEDIPKMPYLQAVLRESLRIQAPIAQHTSTPIEDTFLVDGDKKYEVKKGQSVTIFIAGLHRDPKIWGDDVEVFRPERMMDGKFEALPPHSWEPFSSGIRGCIGRPFAWQEIQLVMATIMQTFNLSLHDPSYQLQLKQTMTLKPDNFRINVAVRPGRNPGFGPIKPDQGSSTATTKDTSSQASSAQKLYVYYGSNTGTSESFAQRIANIAGSNGFSAEIGTLDSVVGRIPTNGPVIIITASFEGEPADNAGQFVEYLKNLPEGSKTFENVKFTVFGCGNREWVNTYQKIPTLCDKLIAEHGGKRILERGEGDAGGSKFFEEFDEWETKLWAVLKEHYGTTSSKRVESLDIELSKGTERSTRLRQDAALGKVLGTRILTKPGVPAKLHIEIELPEDIIYRPGDYLAILPTNPPTAVKRVLKHFNLSEEQEITISTASSTTLPTGTPISVASLLKGYVELAQPATKRNIQTLIDISTGSDKSALEDLLSAFDTKVQEKHHSVLDILESFPSVSLPFGAYLQMLPAMRIRQYSISSSPLWNPSRVTLTVGVLEVPTVSLSGKEDIFLGVASNYLANLQTGDKVQLSVRQSAIGFHLPEDPTVPIIMFAAGSGLAPMRGFIQERALQAASGREVGKALLFFGCRKPDEDFLYSDAELAEWIKAGVVEVIPTFSRSSDKSDGCKYIQDRIWKERAKVKELFDKGAKVFTCGTAAVSNGVKAACIEIIKESGIGEERAQAYFQKIQKERFSSDVFG